MTEKYVIQSVELDDSPAVEDFIRLPYRLYAHTPQWTPPLLWEQHRILDPAHNFFFKHSPAAFFLVREKQGPPVGRIAVLANRRYNEFNKTREAFFYLFECIDDLDAAIALFDTAAAWAKSQGMVSLIGPKGFSALDGMGLLVRGFQHRPAFGIPYNFSYYADLLKSAGFQPAGDTESGYLSGEARLPLSVHQLADRIRQRRGLEVSRFTSRSQLRTFVPHLRELYNNSLEGTTGNTPLTAEEAAALAGQLIWFADPRLIKIIFKSDQPVGFLFAYPDLSASLQRNRGRLLPFGWLDLVRERKRTTWVNINGVGMTADYRGLGGTALLFSEMEKSIVAGRFKHADLVQIGVDNDRMRRELRELGVDFYKQHRVYNLSL